MFQPSACSFVFLIASGVLFLLYHSLSKTKSRSPARKAYNLSLLAAALWMAMDFFEYSAATSSLAWLFLVLATLCIALTLYFILTAGFLLAGKSPGIIRYIPLLAAAVLSPFFEVQPGVFTTFSDKFNIPLGAWLVVEFVFFLLFPAFLVLARKRCTTLKTIKRMNCLIYASAFVILFTFTYYLASLFYSLPPATWAVAILYAGLTYKAFK